MPSVSTNAGQPTPPAATQPTSPTTQVTQSTWETKFTNHIVEVISNNLIDIRGGLLTIKSDTGTLAKVMKVALAIFPGIIAYLLAAAVGGVKKLGNCCKKAETQNQSQAPPAATDANASAATDANASAATNANASAATDANASAATDANASANTNQSSQ